MSRPRCMLIRCGRRAARSAAAAALAMIAWGYVPAARAQELAPDAPPRDRDRDRDRPRDRERDRDNADEQDRRQQSPEREALRKRFEDRLNDINRLKNRGVAGETSEGYIEALDQRLLGKDERALIDDENKDRKSLYALIAERVDDDKDRRKVPPRVVAERNAKRKFENARADEYLKIDEGRWIQKRDENRAEQIARLKRDGVVGETWEGYLAAVKTRPDDDVKDVVDRENRARREMYREIARQLEKVELDEVARNAARDTREHLPPGHYFKERDGDWQKRPARDR